MNELEQTIEQHYQRFLTDWKQYVTDLGDHRFVLTSGGLHNDNLMRYLHIDEQTAQQLRRYGSHALIFLVRYDGTLDYEVHH